MIEKLWEAGIRPVFERQRLEILQSELNYSYSGEVSDETALRVGQRIGVNTVVYGTLRKIGDNYRLSIRAANVETAQLVFPRSYDLQIDSRLAGLLGISDNALSQNQPVQHQPQTPDISGKNTEYSPSPFSVKLSLGLIIGAIFSDNENFQYWGNQYILALKATEMTVNLLNPTVNVRFIYSLKNGINLGFGGELAIAFFRFDITGHSSESDVISGGILAPYIIAGYKNFNLHLGYDFDCGGLYLAPVYTIMERLMIGFPITLFGTNQRGLMTFYNPPRHRVNPPEKYSNRSKFQFGLSVQYVFNF